MRTLLSTKDVAILMDVTETTIKRWAGAGKLPCVKTLGGHRKFVLKDIVAFADQHNYPLSGVLPPELKSADDEMIAFSIQTQNYGKISEVVLKEALHGERGRLSELFVYLSKHHISMATIGDEIIRPAMVKVGELWAEHKLEINQEHVASQALLEAIIRLGPELQRKPSNGLSAVCACAEGDYHEIGLRILSYVLECEGWSVSYLGANTPSDTLGSFIKAMRPELICLSYTLDKPRSQFMGNVQSLGNLAHAYGATFLVGGFHAENHSPQEYHCDHISTSAHDAVSFLRDTFELRPGPKKSKASVS